MSKRTTFAAIMAAPETSATSHRPFIVTLTNGMCLVVRGDGGSGVAALHSKPICPDAAAAMVNGINYQSEPWDPRETFDDAAERCEMEARILKVIADTYARADGVSQDVIMRGVASALANQRPWKRCYAEPVNIWA